MERMLTMKWWLNVMKKSNGEGKERDEEKKMVLVVATNDEIEEMTNECTPHATLLLIIIAASASAIVVQVSYEFYSRDPFTAAACTLTLTLIKTTIQEYNTIQQEKEDDECLIMLLLIQLRRCYQLLPTISSSYFHITTSLLL